MIGGVMIRMERERVPLQYPSDERINGYDEITRGLMHYACAYSIYEIQSIENIE